VRQITKSLVPVLAASILLAACGSSSSSSSSSQSATSAADVSQPSSNGSAPVVKTASNSTLGASVLVDAKGLTLYSLSGEQHGKWICTSTACLHAWHPLTAAAGSAPSGSVKSLATVKRPGGAMQVTYKGMPLYTFVEDQSPGQAKGQGIKDVGTWTAISTSGAVKSKPASAAPAPAATTTSSSSAAGGGYAY
jgi:predicted lipoprotein with Yx(FWY)xxD motif